jgi:RsiW-degrading membrane proteinase PrsW (M82 family)
VLKWLSAFLGSRGRALVAIELAAALLVTAIVTILLQRPSSTVEAPLARAEALQKTGRLGPAEKIFWSALTEGEVTVPLLVGFLDNHHGQRALVEEGFLGRGEHFVVPEDQIDALLARPAIPDDVRTLGTFWRNVLDKSVAPELRVTIVAMAAREPPVPFSNHLLGLEARREGKLPEAAARLEREAIRFPQRNEDLVLAMTLLAMVDAWDDIGERVRNPELSRRIPPNIRYEYAVRARDYPLAVRSIVATMLEPRPHGPLALAAVSGVMWLLFAFRLGQAAARPRFRIPLYLSAFVLGVLSVLPTAVVVGLEDSLLHFRERGEFVSDLIFFTVGVGLREELAKLLLFLPLLPILRRYGTRLDVLACGAIVGLGFASEENIQYLQAGLSTALSRFLTANFLHMALTAMLALAAYDMSRDPERGAPIFSRALLTVVLLHGAYDFFLSNPQMEGLSFLAMTIFVVLTRMFMSEVRAAMNGPGAPLLPRFIQAVIVVTCASFVYASTFVGPVGAALALAQGLLGMILIVIMFVQEMRRF